MKLYQTKTPFCSFSDVEKEMFIRNLRTKREQDISQFDALRPSKKQVLSLEEKALLKTLGISQKGLKNLKEE